MPPYFYKNVVCEYDGTVKFICSYCLARYLKDLILKEGNLNFPPALTDAIKDIRNEVVKLREETAAQKRINHELCRSYQVEDGKRLIDME